jgi:hypothetical protein
MRKSCLRNFRVSAGLIAAILIAISPAFAQEKAASDDIKKDIAAHRRIAQVHEAAARCLEAGKPESECHEELQKACKGVGIGKYCGMKHRH